MRRRSILTYVVPLAAIAVVATIGFAAAHTSTSVSAATADAAALPGWAMNVAQRVAAANGDVTPAQVQFSLTTPARAATVIDETSSDTATQVYAVVMRGDFTMYTEHLPQGVDPPHADWIMLVLDPRDESVGGMAAAAGTPNTSAMGTMTATSLSTE